MNSRTQWPVKILLAHPKASFLKKERLTIAADCSVLVNRDLSSRFKDGETTLIGCPLLEDPDRTMEKLRLIIRETPARKVRVYTMEVPCCHALHLMVIKAVKENGRGNMDTEHYIIRVSTGRVEPFRPGVIDKSMLEAEKKAHGHG